MWQRILPDGVSFKQIHKLFMEYLDDETDMFGDDLFEELCRLVGFEEKWQFYKDPPPGYKNYAIQKKINIGKLLKKEIVDKLISEYDYKLNRYEKNNDFSLLKEEDGITSLISIDHDRHYYYYRINGGFVSNLCIPRSRHIVGFMSWEYQPNITACLPTEFLKLEDAPAKIAEIAQCVFERIIPTIQEEQKKYFINAPMRDEAMHNGAPYLEEYLNLFKRIPESEEDAKELFRQYLIGMKDDSTEEKRKKFIVLACGYIEYLKKRWPYGYLKDDGNLVTQLIFHTYEANYNIYIMLFSWYEEFLAETIG
jgi:hypothetical protein